VSATVSCATASGAASGSAWGGGSATASEGSCSVASATAASVKEGSCAAEAAGAGLGAAWIFGQVARRTDRVEREDDWLADRKRKIERRGQKVRMGVER
jgi:hypothetical protein